VISYIILIASVGGLAQFGISYWRSILAGMAAKQLSAEFAIASGLDHETPLAEDFGALLSLNRLTPGLNQSAGKMVGLQAYFTAVKMLSGLPALKSWAQSELNICSRYLAVIVDQRLSHNLACAAEMRSY
jgi:hypothetical protein